MDLRAIQRVQDVIVGGVIGVTASSLYHKRDKVKKYIKEYSPVFTDIAYVGAVGAAVGYGVAALAGIGATIGSTAGAVAGVAYVIEKYSAGSRMSPTVGLVRAPILDIVAVGVMGAAAGYGITVLAGMGTAIGCAFGAAAGIAYVIERYTAGSPISPVIEWVRAPILDLVAVGVIGAALGHGVITPLIGIETAGALFGTLAGITYVLEMYVAGLPINPTIKLVRAPILDLIAVGAMGAVAGYGITALAGIGTVVGGSVGALVGIAYVVERYAVGSSISPAIELINMPILRDIVAVGVMGAAAGYSIAALAGIGTVVDGSVGALVGTAYVIERYAVGSSISPTIELINMPILRDIVASGVIGAAFGHGITALIGIGTAIGSPIGALAGVAYVIGRYAVGCHISPTIELVVAGLGLIISYPALVSGPAVALAAYKLGGGRAVAALFMGTLGAGYAYNIEFFMGYKVPSYAAITGAFAGLVGGPMPGISVGVLNFIRYDKYYHEYQLVQDPYACAIKAAAATGIGVAIGWPMLGASVGALSFIEHDKYYHEDKLVQDPRIACAIKAVAATGIGASIGPVGAELGEAFGIAICAKEFDSAMLSTVANAFGITAIAPVIAQGGAMMKPSELILNVAFDVAVTIDSMQGNAMLSSLLLGSLVVAGTGYYAVEKLSEVIGLG